MGPVNELVDGEGAVRRLSGTSAHDVDSTPSSPLLSRRSRSFSLPLPVARLIERQQPAMASDLVTMKMVYMLYLCHFLSTWNARVYEFAAVLFTASAFPEDLLASSIFGMVMSVTILGFASLLGTWVDRSPSRLATMCSTITANRASVIASCLCWLFIVGNSTVDNATDPKPEDPQLPIWVVLKKLIFVLIMVFGVIERLSRTANLLSIERDWVPTLAPSTGTAADSSRTYGLAEMNAVMSRIDLVCKLVAPIAISSFSSLVGSMKIVCLVLVIWNALSFAPEIATARVVWNESNLLRAPKESDPEDNSIIPTPWTSSVVDYNSPIWKQLSFRIYHGFWATILCVKIWFEDYRENLRIFFKYHVWIPSMALSILHFSVLNYSATLTVYLLSSGFSMNVITMARAFSSVTEIGSTFFYPLGVRLCGRMYDSLHQGPYASVNNSEDDNELLESQEHERESPTEESKTPFRAVVDMGVATLGIWALAQMGLSLIPSLPALWTLSIPRDPNSPPPPHSTFITAVLLTTIPLSRFGRWTNHLNTQQLTQTLVPPAHRSGFAGAEMGLVSLFGMGHWVVTATWSRHEQFKWLALGSVAAVGISTGGYWWWLRRVRGERFRERGG